MNNKKSGIVWLYKDNSTASEQVEKELEERKIQYRTIWDAGSSRPRPAIEVGSLFAEGLSNIKLYYFGLLDAGYHPKETHR